MKRNLFKGAWFELGRAHQSDPWEEENWSDPLPNTFRHMGCNRYCGYKKGLCSGDVMIGDDGGKWTSTARDLAGTALTSEFLQNRGRVNRKTGQPDGIVDVAPSFLVLLSQCVGQALPSFLQQDPLAPQLSLHARGSLGL